MKKGGLEGRQAGPEQLRLCGRGGSQGQAEPQRARLRQPR